VRHKEQRGTEIFSQPAQACFGKAYHLNEGSLSYCEFERYMLSDCCSSCQHCHMSLCVREQKGSSPEQLGPWHSTGKQLGRPLI